MGFTELWIEVLAVSIVVFVLYMITAGFVMLRRRMRLSVILCRALLLASIAGAIVYELVSNADIQNITPLLDWRKIPEIGYKAVWIRVAYDTVPFALGGLLLPFAYRSCNRFSRAALWGFSIALFYGVLRFAMGSFDIDELIYCFWGFMVGFSFSSLLAGLFPKAKLFKTINFRTSAYIIGVLILMGTFFAGVAALLLNNGSDFVELKLPPQSRQLPEAKISAALSDETQKVDTFKTIPPVVNEDILRVAETIGIDGEIDEATEERSYATISDGNIRLNYYSAGNWSYTDSSAVNKKGTVPDDQSCARIVEDVASGGLARNYSIYRSYIEEISDNEGEIISKQVTVEAAYAGKRVVGSCEFIAEIGPGGIMISLDKHDADFEPYKQVNIISSNEAYQLLKNGGIRSDGKVITINHNLYQDPESVEIYDTEIAYWLEETKGYLQPIWLFSARAQLIEGGTKEFDIYVPAIKY